MISGAKLLAAVVMLLLVLQWGSTTHAWNSGLIISLLGGSAVMTLHSLGWQWYRGDKALIPPRIMRQPNVIAGCLCTFFLTGTLSVHIYYLLAYFQVIKNDNASHSGTSLTYYLLWSVIFSIIAGAVATKSGYYNPPALPGPLVNLASCALLTTLKIDTSTPTWIGFHGDPTKPCCHAGCS